MPNVLKITCDNPDEILNAGAYAAGAVIRIQWSATETGTYADLSGTGSTPTIPVVTLTRYYAGYDPAGASSTWYRTRYENVGATRLSDWSASFQAGAEGAGYLCSLYDVEQRLVQSGSSLNSDEREQVVEIIREVSDYVANVAGRQFVPDPLSGDRTIRLHTRWGRALWVPKGIRSITTLGIASTDQPSSGGTYTTAAATAYYIDPPEYERAPGWPGTWIVLSQTLLFYDAAFGAEITGAFGFAAVPPAIQAVALNLVVGAWRARAAAGSSGITLNVDGSRTWEPMLTNKDKATLALFSRGPML